MCFPYWLHSTLSYFGAGVHPRFLGLVFKSCLCVVLSWLAWFPPCCCLQPDSSPFWLHKPFSSLTRGSSFVLCCPWCLVFPPATHSPASPLLRGTSECCFLCLGCSVPLQSFPPLRVWFKHLLHGKVFPPRPHARSALSECSAHRPSAFLLQHLAPLYLKDCAVATNLSPVQS